MKTSTYGILVLLTFLRNYDKPYCPSIKKLIDISDNIGKKLGCEQDFTYVTKYTVIKNLIKDGLLIQERKGNCIHVSMSEEVKKFIMKIGEENGRRP